MAVINKDELNKLTIPQLKEKLKQRQLPISGTKSELVSRLHDNIQEEENLLTGSSSGGMLFLRKALLNISTIKRLEH